MPEPKIDGLKRAAKWFVQALVDVFRAIEPGLPIPSREAEKP